LQDLRVGFKADPRKKQQGQEEQYGGEQPPEQVENCYADRKQEEEELPFDAEQCQLLI
jgi:hypothetical protein